MTDFPQVTTHPQTIDDSHWPLSGGQGYQKRLYGAWRLLAPLVYRVGALAGSLLYIVRHRGNNDIYERMCAAYADAKNKRTGNWRRIIRQYRQSIVYEKLDMVSMGFALMARMPDALIALQGRDNLDEALARGKGALIVFGHLSSPQCGVAAVGQAYPQRTHLFLHNLPARASGVRRLFRQWFWDHVLKRTFDQRLLLPGDAAAALKASRALGRNEIVMIAADVAWREAKGVPIMLMGQEVQLPLGAVALAERTGSPILLMRIERQPSLWQHIVTIGPPIAQPPHEDRTTRLRRIVDLVEQEIRTHPEAWLQW